MARQVAVLGPLSSDVATRAFLACEVIDDVPRSDRPLVVVWIPDEVVDEPVRLARLQRETSMLTRLVHPNLARVHGLHRFEEGWARIIEYTDGEPLRRIAERIREERRAVEPRILGRIASDLCSGVHYAHQQGLAQAGGLPIVHGGLRPDAVLVAFSGGTQVTGYGASAFIGLPDGAGGAGLDARHYLAPEQILGGPQAAGVATDVYGIGAIIYELLVGHPPFSGAIDVEQAILTAELAVPPLSSRADALMNVALRALSRRGSDRFASAFDLDAAIHDALGPEGIASEAEVARLLEALLPADHTRTRLARHMLLDVASDPDATTVLTASSDLPGATDRAAMPAFPGSPPGNGKAHVSAETLPVPSVLPEPAPSSPAESVHADPEPTTTPPSVREREAASSPEPDAGPSVEAGAAPLSDPHGWFVDPDPLESAAPASGGSAPDLQAPASVEPPGKTGPTPTHVAASQREPPGADAPSADVEAAPLTAAPPEGQPARADEPAWPEAAEEPQASPAAPTGVEPGARSALASGLELPPPAAPVDPGARAVTSEPGPTLEIERPVAADLHAPAAPASTSSPWTTPVSNPAEGLIPAEPASSAVSSGPAPGSPRPRTPSGLPTAAAAPESPWSAASPAPDSALAEALAAPAGHPKPRPARPLISEITFFDQRTGDGSRYAMWAVALAAFAGLLFIVLFPKPPPEGLAEPAAGRKKLPPELVAAAMQRAETPGAEAAAEAAPAGATGAARITCSPEVDVFRGSEALGRTPATVVLPVGRHELRLTDAEARINTYRQIDVREGEMTRLEVTLAKAELAVKGPRGADVFLNGARVARLPLAPLELYEGDYVLEVRHEGHRWSQPITADPGGQVRVRVEPTADGVTGRVER